jgi:hypothetical protein
MSGHTMHALGRKLLRRIPAYRFRIDVDKSQWLFYVVGFTSSRQQLSATRHSESP